jgi:hypothetical protein
MFAFLNQVCLKQKRDVIVYYFVLYLVYKFAKFVA